MKTALEKMANIKGAQFLPAISTATTGYLFKYNDEEFKAHSNNIIKSFRFFNDDVENNYFTHPYVLISASHLFKKTEDIRKHLSINDDTLIFIDSGGYSLASGAIKAKDWDDEKAFNWSNKNGDIFPILDRPLIPNCSYDKHLALSLRSAKYYKEHRTADDGKVILNVVQGRNKQELDKWIDIISNVGLDGWAHGGHGGNMINIVYVVLELIKRGLMTESKLHHVFGVSSCASMVYFAVIQDEMKKMGFKTQLTYDSSYFQRSFAFGNYFLFKKFDGMVNIRLSNRYDWSNVPTDMELPCNCSICDNVKNVPEFFDDSMVFYMCGAMHNLNQMLEYKKSVEQLFRLNIVKAGTDKEGNVYDVAPFIESILPTKMWKNINTIRWAFREIDDGYSIMAKYFINKGLVEESQPKLGDLM